jgi:DNA mismatch repair protein MutL
MPIRVLDPIVASQIAAGEVVERPASVVKELLENALDAGAKRIGIDIRGGGVTELRIQDDGSGIPADEIELAFQRHATSKLISAEDLYAIGTLGFRGEALPSIAAVAQVSCVSRVASSPTGVELRIAGGEIQSRSTVGAPPGTTFTIRNLFYNIPVRREFLRAPGAESAAISAIVTQYALAYPHIRFSLTIDGKLRLQTNGSGLIKDVIFSVYGLDIARAMLAIDFSDGGDLTGIAARGFVSPPTLHRGSRDAMHISVNGRAVAPRGQVAAILDDAYHTLLMKSRFPYVILGVKVHPAAVDVNVHPTKSEVKFRDPDRVRAVIAREIRTIVQGSVVVQGWDGAHVPADPEATPTWADDPEPETTMPTLPDSQPAPTGLRQQPNELTRRELTRPANPIREIPPIYRPAPSNTPPPNAPNPWPERVTPAPAEPALRPNAPTPNLPPAPPPPVADQQHLPSGELAPLARQATSAGLPRLRCLAQLARMYLLAEGPDGDLYLIDQHAAHERITYERLMAQHGGGTIESQRLLMPQAISLPPATQATLLEAATELNTWGFELEEAEAGIRVRAIPASIALEQLKPALIEVADHLSGAGGSTPATWREEMLVTLSCHTSIRTGHPLTPAEQQALIDQLSQCQGPRTCPHGRPTVIVLTKQQLTRQFGRLGA